MVRIGHAMVGGLAAFVCAQAHARVAAAERAALPDGIGSVELDGVAEFSPTRTSSGTPLRWAASCVRLRPHLARAADVSAADFDTALRSTAAAWESATRACGYLRFELEPAESGDVDLDYVNRIIVREERWCRVGPPEHCHDPAAIGLTTLYYVDRPGDPRDGEILDADIELNAVDFALAICDPSSGGCASTGAGSLADLANVLTHELGHAFGLDHTCWAGAGPQPLDDDGAPVPPCVPVAALPPEVTEATMYNYSEPGETSKRTPEADDVAGFCRAYPLGSDPARCAPAEPFGPGPDGGVGEMDTGGGCCQTSNRDAPSLLALTLGLASLRRQRRAGPARR